MKAQKLIILVLLALFSKTGYAQSSSYCSKQLVIPNRTFADSIEIKLKAMDLRAYEGQPVDTLLHHLPSGVVKMEITGWRSVRVAENLYVVYPGGLCAEIHVRNFQFMNPKLVNTETPMQNWKIDLFKKESVTYTVIYRKGVCINGCENQFR